MKYFVSRITISVRSEMKISVLFSLIMFLTMSTHARMNKVNVFEVIMMSFDCLLNVSRTTSPLIISATMEELCFWSQENWEPGTGLTPRCKLRTTSEHLKQTRRWWRESGTNSFATTTLIDANIFSTNNFTDHDCYAADESFNRRQRARLNRMS